MVSFLALEVNVVMVPVLTIFLLYCVPIPAVSKLAARVTQLIEAYHFNGLTIMTAMAVASSISFLFHFLEWHTKYDAKAKFHDISLQLQHDNKRLRVERNMYIQLVTCVLCLAVKKCAALLKNQAPRPAAPARTTSAAATHAKSA